MSSAWIEGGKCEVFLKSKPCIRMYLVMLGFKRYVSVKETSKNVKCSRNRLALDELLYKRLPLLVLIEPYLQLALASVFDCEAISCGETLDPDNTRHRSNAVCCVSPDDERISFQGSGGREGLLDRHRKDMIVEDGFFFRLQVGMSTLRSKSNERF